jgi:hypothetical protein
VADVRRHRYLGSLELRDQQPSDRVEMDSEAALDRWLAAQDRWERAEPFTFVVDLQQRLWLAPRRSEHVRCADGADVLAAGEIQFQVDGLGRAVSRVSNQSTGYCPDLDCWVAVQRALDRAGVRHPHRLTDPVAFRGCPTCYAINIVRDDDFVCAVCASDLPDRWNLNDV